MGDREPELAVHVPPDGRPAPGDLVVMPAGDIDRHDCLPLDVGGAVIGQEDEQRDIPVGLHEVDLRRPLLVGGQEPQGRPQAGAGRGPRPHADDAVLEREMTGGGHHS